MKISNLTHRGNHQDLKGRGVIWRWLLAKLLRKVEITKQEGRIPQEDKFQTWFRCLLVQASSKYRFWSRLITDLWIRIDSNKMSSILYWKTISSCKMVLTSIHISPTTICTTAPVNNHYKFFKAMPFRLRTSLLQITK